MSASHDPSAVNGPSGAFADLTERVEAIRTVASLDLPPDPRQALEALRREIQQAATETDPVPRPPFPSHRRHGAGLVGGLKTAIAALLRPLSRLLFQRQAEFNRRVVAIAELGHHRLAELAEHAAWQADRVGFWSQDLARARAERREVLDALERIAAEVAALRERIEAARGEGR